MNFTALKKLLTDCFCCSSASQLERERIQHEKIQQKRIDESITSVLSEKCVIIDEEEDIIDEFPPLTDPQNKFVQYALHGPRNEVRFITLSFYSN